MLRSKLKYLVFIGLAVIIASCGGKTFPVDPVMKLKEKMTKEKSYTILLNDMDLKDGQYKHQYKLLVDKEDKIDISLTDWEDITDEFYLLHANDLGMEVLSKNETGRLNELMTPPGYSNYIGKEKYGNWKVLEADSLVVRLDTSFTHVYPTDTVWRFNEQYLFLRTELGIDSLEVHQHEYEQYLTLYRYNRPYYGPITQKKPVYGTHGFYFIHSRPAFYSRRSANNDFRKSGMQPSSFNHRGGGGFGK